jgi:hypothetical protein
MVLGIGFLILNFAIKASMPKIEFLIKLPIIIAMFLFSMPLAIFIYVIVNKYKLMQLGLKTKAILYLLLRLILLALTRLLAMVFNRTGLL